MLVIICGEDTSSSRRYFQELQKSYQGKGYFLQDILPGELLETLKDAGDTVTLFNEKKAYVVENLTKIISRKTSVAVAKQLKNVTDDPNLLVIDWESGKPARLITVKEASIKEFKLPKSIFKLLDECYPGNIITFIHLFHELTDHLEPEFIFAMLSRHTRTLVLASQNALPSSVPSWQRAKLHSQADKWKVTQLLAFYEGLARIDQNTKTSSDALGMQKAVDILATICLR